MNGLSQEVCEWLVSEWAVINLLLNGVYSSYNPLTSHYLPGTSKYSDARPEFQVIGWIWENGRNSWSLDVWYNKTESVFFPKDPYTRWTMVDPKTSYKWGN